MKKTFTPNQPLTPSSIARLISLFFYREGEECPAAKAAKEILESEIGRTDTEVQKTVLGQLHELAETHKTYWGKPYDLRSQAAKEK